MRVLSGEFKGRRIKAPSSKATRPTSARVKKSLFDMLEARVDLSGYKVLDLFAGSGALGIESISRGASNVTFVENSVRTLRDNMSLISSDVADVRVVKGDAVTYLKSAAASGTKYDLVFLDPPYSYDNWQETLQLASRVLIQTSLLVVESDQEVILPDCLRLEKVKSYGSTVVTIAGLAEPIVSLRIEEEDS